MAAQKGGHLVLDRALDDELCAETAELGQTIGVGHSVEQDGVDLLDQALADGYSVVHGVPPRCGSNTTASETTPSSTFPAGLGRHL
ncbi:MAG: hypothetical protein DLM71_04895 [Chloroflexi bacterium]|nr:hypothetical protein [Candidatus Dormibacteraeota bacterium]PZR63252.1 MAG: hypothetical protein DLM71_04895 [Chloroflexota bacterium]